MDVINEFERDQRILSELKELLQFAPPGKLRRSIEDVFFLYLSESEGKESSLPREAINNFYYLVNFLNEVEELY